MAQYFSLVTARLTGHYEAAPQRAHQVGLLPRDDRLDDEGHDQLEGPEAGHQAGGDHLQGLGHASEPHQARGCQP